MIEKPKLVWITGGTSGIGYSLVKRFINSEIHVLTTSHNRKKIIELEKYFSNFKNFHADFCDVRDADTIIKIISDYSSNFNIVSLINNAGITSFSPFENNNLDEINSIIDTNLKGPIYTIKNLLPELIRNSGTIINILSVAAVEIFENSSLYAASKAGLLSFSNVLREELRKYNVRVINILPGATNTPIWGNDSIEKFGDRMMNPDDLADFIYNIWANNSTVTLENITLKPITGNI